METMFIWVAIGTAASLVAMPKLAARLMLSRAKHRSLAGHSKMSRQIAKLLPFYDYDESIFFRADDAPDDIAAVRRAAFMRLSALYAERFPDTVSMTAEVVDGISDLQFTSRYRVPFQFSR